MDLVTVDIFCAFYLAANVIVYAGKLHVNWSDYRDLSSLLPSAGMFKRSPSDQWSYIWTNKHHMFTYDTVSEAVNGLKSRGYTLDFNLDENCIFCGNNKLNPDQFEITEIHRFEGDSDPSDEAIVYAIESRTGMKGVLVNGYGVSSQTLDADIAKKLQVHLYR